MSEQVSVGGKIDEQAFTRWWYNLLSSGFFSSRTATSWKVKQRGAGANMSVDVAQGDGMIDISSSYMYGGWVASSDKNVSVTAADPSNPRIDRVVAYIDLATISTSVTNNTGALKFLAVAGTAAGSPTAPSNGTVQSAVGASNPYIDLAQLAVAAGATSIVTANITDKRKSVSLIVPRAPVITALSATTTGDQSHDIVHMDASGGARTYTLGDATLLSGRMFTIRKSDSSTNVVTISTTSSQTIAHFGGSAPTQTALVNQGDFIEVYSDGTNWVVIRDGRSVLLTSASRSSDFTTTSSSDTVSGAVITTISPLTITVPAGLKYEVVLYAASMSSNQAGNTSILEIWDGDNTSGGTKIGQGNRTQYTGGGGDHLDVKTKPQAALSSNTSKTFNFTAHAPAGSTTTTVSAGTGSETYAEVRLIK